MDDKAIIRKVFDAMLIDYDYRDAVNSEDEYVLDAFDTIGLDFCPHCEAGQLCLEAAWCKQAQCASQSTFLDLDLCVRQEIYSFLRTDKPKRLEWRPVARFARYGIPVHVLLLCKQIYDELLEYITTNNTFTILAGHHILPGTILTPLPYEIGGLLTPPSQWISQLSIILEIDLDLLFRPAYQDSELTEIEDDVIFGTINRLAGRIKDADLPNLERISLSIYEIIPPTKRIHLSCQIFEPTVQHRYEQIIRPLTSLPLEDGLWVEDIDIIYGDGYTLEGGCPDTWERADDYFHIIANALNSLEIRSRFCIPLSHTPFLSLPHNSNSDQLSATALFRYQSPTNAPEPSHNLSSRSFPFNAIQSSSLLSPHPLTPIPERLRQLETPTPPGGSNKLRKPSRSSLSRPGTGSLRRYWNEGASALVRRRSSHPPVGTALRPTATLARAKTATGSLGSERKGPTEGKGPAEGRESPSLVKEKRGRKNEGAERKTSSVTGALGKWFNEGVDTLTSTGSKEKLEKGRWDGRELKKIAVIVGRGKVARSNGIVPSRL